MLTKIKIFGNFGQNQDFLKTLTNIKISKHFDQNRDFRKLWPESIFSEKFYENQHYRKFGRKSRCSKFFTKIEIFQKILTIIEILENFCPILRIWTISTKIEIIGNYDQNRDDFRKCWQKQDFRKFWPNSSFFLERRPISRFPKNFDQNRDFRKLLRIEIFRKLLLPKSTFFKILTKIEMLKNVDQVQTKILTKTEIFMTILIKNETFKNFDRNGVFRKFRPKSRFWPASKRSFFLNQNRYNFLKCWQKSGFSKILAPNYFFSKTMTGIKISICFTKIDIFRIIYPKFSLSENFDQNLFVPRLSPKSRFFDNFSGKSSFFEHFKQNQDYRKFLLNSG